MASEGATAGDLGPLADPMGHSLDSDAFHFPKGGEWNVYEWSQAYMGNSLSWLGITGLSKFMFLELVAVFIILAIFFYYLQNIKRHGHAK
jgi:hypothetical protein